MWNFLFLTASIISFFSIPVQFTPTGIATVPLVNNKPAQQQQFENLDEKTKSKLRENKKTVDSQVAITLQNVRKIDKEYMDSIKELQNQVATFTVEGQIETLIEKYKDLGNIIKQLKDIKNDIVTNIDKFLPQKNTGPAMPFMPAQNNQPDFKRPLTEYQVNIYTDNSGTKGAPVIVESQPHYMNLFGTIERELVMGAMFTNFTLIQEGSISKANGG